MKQQGRERQGEGKKQLMLILMVSVMTPSGFRSLLSIVHLTADRRSVQSYTLCSDSFKQNCKTDLTVLFLALNKHLGLNHLVTTVFMIL